MSATTHSIACLAAPLPQRRRPPLLLAAILLAGVATAAAAPPAMRLFNRHLAARQLQRAWTQQLNSPECITNAPVAWIRAPTWGLSQPILPESHPSALSGAPTLRPINDRPDCSVIYAHRDRHFRTLRHARQRDVVRIQRADGKLTTYRVSSLQAITREAAPLILSRGAATGRVALLTCYPFHFVGPAPDRLILWLDPIEITATLPYHAIESIYGDDDGQSKQEEH